MEEPHGIEYGPSSSAPADTGWHQGHGITRCTYTAPHDVKRTIKEQAAKPDKPTTGKSIARLGTLFSIAARKFGMSGSGRSIMTRDSSTSAWSRLDRQTRSCAYGATSRTDGTLSLSSKGTRIRLQVLTGTRTAMLLSLQALIRRLGCGGWTTRGLLLPSASFAHSRARPWMSGEAAQRYWTPCSRKFGIRSDSSALVMIDRIF